MEGHEEQLLFFKGGREAWKDVNELVNEEEEFEEEYDDDYADELDEDLVEVPTQLHFAFPQSYDTYSMLCKSKLSNKSDLPN